MSSRYRLSKKHYICHMIWKRLWMIMAVAMAIACEPEKPGGNINLKQDSIILNAGSERVRFDFSATGEWSASLADASWCSISPDGGRAGDATIMVSAIANTAPEERSTKLTITCSGISTEIMVIQKAAGVVRLSPQEISSPAEGGTFYVGIEHNIEYNTIVGAAAQGWVTVSPADKALTESKIRLDISPNESGWSRTGSVTVTSDAGDLPITITQDGADIFSLSAMSQVLPGTGGSFSVSVSGTRNYHISSKPEWITETSVSGRTHSFEAAPYYGSADRTDYIVFCDDGGVCLPFEVRQEWLPSWAAQNFKHTSLVMRFTATWCGWCPRMNRSVQKAQADYPGKLEHLALHGSGSTLYFPQGNDLMDQYKINGFPTGIVDGRILVENEGINATAQKIIDASKETESTYSTVSGASVTSTLTSSKLKVNLTLYLRSAGDYKVTVLLVEDGIDAAQENYEGDNYSHYTHDGVARASLTSITGDEFSMEKAFRSRDFSYETTLSSKWNASNMRILVYVQAPYGNRKKIRSRDYGNYYIDNCFSAVPGKDLILETE